MTPRQDHDDLHGHGRGGPVLQPRDVAVLVCGGRDLHPGADDAWWVRAWLLHLDATTVIHGAGPHRCEAVLCRRPSVDHWAGLVARRLGLRAEAFPADWKAQGHAAGPARNLRMLDRGPQAVLALPGKRGALHRPGSGTGHTVHHARERGIPVVLRGDGWPPGYEGPGPQRS